MFTQLTVIMRMIMLMRVLMVMFVFVVMHMSVAVFMAVHMGKIDIFHRMVQLLFRYLIGDVLLVQCLRDDLVEEQGDGSVFYLDRLMKIAEQVGDHAHLLDILWSNFDHLVRYYGQDKEALVPYKESGSVLKHLRFVFQTDPIVIAMV